jgi:hypothetical protein
VADDPVLVCALGREINTGPLFGFAYRLFVIPDRSAHAKVARRAVAGPTARPIRKPRAMSETDQLVAAILAATMNLREPTQESLIAQYEYFLREIAARRRAEQLRAEESANAAWTRR